MPRPSLLAGADKGEEWVLVAAAHESEIGTKLTSSDVRFHIRF
jgi:hypothetical protein